MLIALCDKLAIDPCMRLKDMVVFLHGEFEVDVNRFSIRRALKDISWSKKATQNIAQERNQDLPDEYIYEVSSFRPCQLVFLRRDIDGSQVCERMLALKDKCLHPTTSTPYVKMAIGGTENSPEGIAVSFNSPAFQSFPPTVLGNLFDS